MDTDRHTPLEPPAPSDSTRYVDHRPADIRRATPGHRYAHHIRTLPARLEALSVDLRLPPGGRVLDYGCADVPYRHFFPADAEFVAADLPGNPAATLDLNPDTTIPAPDDSFDAVLSTQVLEHVGDPELYLSECFRVLRPGGRMLLSTHGMFIYHPDPVDYWRWTCAGLRHVIEEAGFRVARFEGVIGLLATGLQFVQDATYYHLPRPLRPVYAFVMQSLVALADRLQAQAARDLNAQVYAVVAEKP
ncbi:MAG TPA: methyltransferase domain-containing protein [Thermoleophilaceae bacterium]|nr:methyltransferase domain-containing protein [Thermoleophilaceae bacterium]